MGFPDRIERTVEFAHPPANGDARKSWTGGHTAQMRGELLGELAGCLDAA